MSVEIHIASHRRTAAERIERSTWDGKILRWDVEGVLHEFDLPNLYRCWAAMNQPEPVDSWLAQKDLS